MGQNLPDCYISVEETTFQWFSWIYVDHDPMRTFGWFQINTIYRFYHNTSRIQILLLCRRVLKPFGVERLLLCNTMLPEPKLFSGSTSSILPDFLFSVITRDLDLFTRSDRLLNALRKDSTGVRGSARGGGGWGTAHLVPPVAIIPPVHSEHRWCQTSVIQNGFVTNFQILKCIFEEEKIENIYLKNFDLFVIVTWRMREFGWVSHVRYCLKNKFRYPL